jgi:hypothetical protein
LGGVVTNIDCAKLGVKLIGLWAMISSSRSVTNVVEAVYINRSSGMPMPFGLAVAALTPLAMGLIGLYLWIHSDRLASSIFPTATAVESSAEGLERLLPLALSLMGVWLVSVAIPTLVYNIALSLFSLAPAYQSVFGRIYQSPVMTVTAKANIVAALVRAFIGFGLLLGSKRLAEIILAMRGRQSFSE